MKKKENAVALKTQNQGVEFQLIQQAVANGAPIETLEKLLAMKERIDAENARKDFYEAMAKFQSECPTIEKKKKVGNGSFGYSYAPLESIVEQTREIIKKNGFSYFIKAEFPKGVVRATCIVHNINGHSEETNCEIPIDDKGRMNDAQKVASALTYAKRYAFCNAFGIMTGDEDTDANDLTNTKWQEEIDKITNLKNLIDYSNKNKGKGKEFDAYIIKRKNELEQTPPQAQNSPVSDNDKKQDKYTKKTFEGVKKWISIATDESKLETTREHLEKETPYGEKTQELLDKIDEKIIDLGLESEFKKGKVDDVEIIEEK